MEKTISLFLLCVSVIFMSSCDDGSKFLTSGTVTGIESKDATFDVLSSDGTAVMYPSHEEYVFYVDSVPYQSRSPNFYLTDSPVERGCEVNVYKTWSNSHFLTPISVKQDEVLKLESSERQEWNRRSYKSLLILAVSTCVVVFILKKYIL